MNKLSSLSHAEALRAVTAIQAELERRKKAAVVAVADEHGELIALLRLDGARLPAIEIAANKAYTAARERCDTKQIGTSVRNPQAGFDIAYYGDPKIIGWGGGLPVRSGDDVAGSVAVSGLSESEDMELAAIGVAAIERG